MVRQLFDSHRELETMKEEKKKMEIPFLEIISQRKSIRVPYDDIVYIESLADYIKIHAEGRKEISSKEKISALEEKLPDFFIRIHRSFIINRNKVTRYNNNEIEIGETVLSIGRSFKKEALAKMKAGEARF